MPSLAHKELKIVYNFLNLPQQITKTGGGGSLQFPYDASGRKWKKEGTGGKREYVLGMEYQDGRLQAIHGPDGRLASVHGFGYYRPEYWNTDHPDPPGTGQVLGNVRLAFSDVNNNGRIEIEDNPGTPEDDTEVMRLSPGSQAEAKSRTPADKPGSGKIIIIRLG